MKSSIIFHGSFFSSPIFMIVLSNPKSGTIGWKCWFWISFSICYKSTLLMYFDSILFCVYLNFILFNLLGLVISTYPPLSCTNSYPLLSSFYILRLLLLTALFLTSRTVLIGIMSNFNLFFFMVASLNASRSSQLYMPDFCVLNPLGSSCSSHSYSYLTLFI